MFREKKLARRATRKEKKRLKAGITEWEESKEEQPEAGE